MRDGLTLRILESIQAVRAADWDALHGPGTHPLVRHGWLRALEEGGVATADRHWRPAHHTLWRGSDLVAAMPCYFRTEDDGEWVAYGGIRLGALKASLPYFPRLVSAVPVTPVPGERILVGSREDADPLRRTMARLLLDAVDRKEVASAHMLFCSDREAELLGNATHRPWLTRHEVHHCYLHQGATTWDEWLFTLPRKRRQAITRERRGIRELGLTVRWIDGVDADEADFRDMARRYALTSRRWGVPTPLLPEPFFLGLEQHARPWVRFAEARKGGQRVALALYSEGGGQLSGRYWGSDEEIPFLHFELCFYAAVERAIERRIPCFNPGHGGEHKELRGLTPVVVRGLHHHAPPGFHRGVVAWAGRLEQVG